MINPWDTRRGVVLPIVALAITALLAPAFSAHADGFQALRHKVNFNNPAGYCDFGDSESERAYVAFVRNAVGPNIRIIKYLT